jgi:hypothetical protein
MGDKKEIQKEALKPKTKVKSKEDKELQELEVESTGGGMGAGGGLRSLNNRKTSLTHLGSNPVHYSNPALFSNL